MKFIINFNDIRQTDSNLVGGKNSSLGQMIKNLSPLGIKIPSGFAITTKAYRYHLEYNNLIEPIERELSRLTKNYNINTLHNVAKNIRNLIKSKKFPREVSDQIIQAYKDLCNYYSQKNVSVAIRSSATAEDLRQASFAGQMDSFLNISGDNNIIKYSLECMASLFNDRAIVYREEKKFDHFSIGISVGIQKMVRSDLESSGIIFTLDTESGFKDTVVITSSYGLGELIVKGLVTPDEFHVHKQTLEKNFKPIIKKYVGTKNKKLVYTSSGKSTTALKKVTESEAKVFSLTDAEILELARQAIAIENYYTKLYGHWSPMDIEWAKDGLDNNLYVVQARPETIHARAKADQLTQYILKSEKKKRDIILTGQSIGNKIAAGKVSILESLKDAAKFREGDILVTHMTDPDWVQLMKKACAIVTDNGGRTCHAAIVSRELGIPALVGTGNATEKLKNRQAITVDCSKGSIGYVYNNILDFQVKEIKIKHIAKPKVPIYLNISDPNRGYKLSFLPNSGIGLARLEFIITNFIKVHPLAITNFRKIKDKKLKEEIIKLASAYKNPEDYYISTLSQNIGMIAAAFYPKPVTVRLTDFKSNEYRNLLGGEIFEPQEENPMLGFRGASRYYNPLFAPAFALECEAIKKARNEMGFSNINIMIPFVRTIEDAQSALKALKDNNLKPSNINISMMCEIPSNIILLEKFAQYFNAFSIGTNDLTQLVLGVDRDSNLVSYLFDERNDAVKKLLEAAIETAREKKLFLSVCGEAPSDFPDFGKFLINQGINALSLEPDSIINFLLN